MLTYQLVNSLDVAIETLKTGNLFEKNLYFYCKINWGLTEEAQSALFLEAAHRLYFFMLSFGISESSDLFANAHTRVSSDGRHSLANILMFIWQYIDQDKVVLTLHCHMMKSWLFLFLLKAALCALKGTAGVGRLFILVL